MLCWKKKKTIKSVERSKTELNQAKSRITCLEDELHDITKKFEVDKENLNDEISQLKEINNEMNLKICVFLEQLSEYKNHVEKLKLELQYSRYKYLYSSCLAIVWAQIES